VKANLLKAKMDSAIVCRVEEASLLKRLLLGESDLSANTNRSGSNGHLSTGDNLGKEIAINLSESSDFVTKPLYFVVGSNRS